jgi:hypothetical protein
LSRTAGQAQPEYVEQIGEEGVAKIVVGWLGLRISTCCSAQAVPDEMKVAVEEGSVRDLVEKDTGKMQHDLTMKGYSSLYSAARVVTTDIDAEK